MIRGTQPVLQGNDTGRLRCCPLYIVVDLDEACRQQQFGEGWFPTFAEVPQKAISMNVGQIMRSKAIVSTVPDARNAAAVRARVEGSVSPKIPVSILQRHENLGLYVDAAAASLLKTG
jgi:glucosamine-6-phosphate deaminase